MSRKTISGKSAAEAEAERLEAERRAAFEGEVPELGPDFFRGAQIRDGGRIVRPADGTLTRRGRPPAGSRPKVQQSLRLSPEVLEHFRAGGAGWQSRIDEVLKRHVAGERGGDGGRAGVAEQRTEYRGEARKPRR